MFVFHYLFLNQNVFPLDKVGEIKRLPNLKLLKYIPTQLQMRENKTNPHTF